MARHPPGLHVTPISLSSLLALFTLNHLRKQKWHQKCVKNDHLLFCEQTIWEKLAKVWIVHLHTAWSSCVLSLCHSPTPEGGEGLVWRTLNRLSLVLGPTDSPLKWHGRELKLCFERSPLFSFSSIICPHQCGKWAHRRWAQGETKGRVERANCKLADRSLAPGNVQLRIQVVCNVLSPLLFFFFF